MKGRSLLALWSLLGCLVATAAESTRETTTVPQPDVDVTAKPANPTPPPAAKPTPDAAATPAQKPAPTDSAAKTPDGDFKPSEEISEDMAVAYPVDI